MYKAGDEIVYGNLGVCSVVEVAQREMPGVEGRRWYYTLEPRFENQMRIYAPTENGRVRMRPVVTGEQARRLLDSIPSLRAAARSLPDGQPEALVADCEEKLALDGCGDLIARALFTCAPRALASDYKRRIGLGDRMAAKQAQQRLLQELGLALNVPPARVREAIDQRIAAPAVKRDAAVQA